MPKRITEADYFITWLVFTLIYLVVSTAIGFVSGFLIGLILNAMGASVRLITTITGVVGFLVGLPISYVIFRFVVAHFIGKKIDAEKEN